MAGKSINLKPKIWTFEVFKNLAVFKATFQPWMQVRYKHDTFSKLATR